MYKFLFHIFIALLAINPLDGMKRTRPQNEAKPPIFNISYWQAVQQRVRQEAQVAEGKGKLVLSPDNILRRMLRLHTNPNVMKRAESVLVPAITVPIQKPAQVQRAVPVYTNLFTMLFGPVKSEEFKPQAKVFKKYPEGLLFDAVKRADRQEVERFLSKESIQSDIKNEDGTNLLHAAAGDVEFLEYLVNTYNLQHLINESDKNNFTPLFAAVKKGNLDAVQYLLAQGADKDRLAGKAFDITLLAYAASYGNIPIVSFLVEELKMPINKTNDVGAVPLHRAAASGHLNVVKYLLAQGAEFRRDNDDGTLVHYAAASNNIELMEYLFTECDMQKFINETEEDGTTPLHRACLEGSPAMVEYLIAQGADLYAIDENARGILHYAAMNDDTHMMQFLLEFIKDYKEKLLDKYAKAKKWIKLQALLNKKDIHIDRGSNKGTPLHIAAALGNLEMVKFLLNHGAGARNLDGKERSPFMVAKKKNKAHIVQFIIDYMAAKEAYTCPICLQEPIAKDQCTVAHLNCLHFLCKTCKATLQAQGGRHAKCPNCRGKLDKDMIMDNVQSLNEEVSSSSD